MSDYPQLNGMVKGEVRMQALLIFIAVAFVMLPGMPREGWGQHMHGGEPHVRGQMVHTMGMMSEIINTKLQSIDN